MIEVNDTIEKIFQREGVFVNVSASGWRRSVQSNQEVSNEEYMTPGQIYFLPKQIRNSFHRIETKANAKIKKNSIGMNYVPILLYDELNQYLTDCKKEFEEVKKEVDENFDQIIKCLTFIDPSLIPDKEELLNSIKFEVRVSTFPSRKNIEFLPEDVRENIENSVVSLTEQYVLESIGGLLNSLIMTLAEKLKDKKTEISNRTISAIKEHARLTKLKNILSNDVVNSLCEKIEELTTENFVELAEIAISQTYVKIKKEKILMEQINWREVPLTQNDMEVLGS